jgi:pSer/pThr/pTyr-binding forkhead associated (FHA) protein
VLPDAPAAPVRLEPAVHPQRPRLVWLTGPVAGRCDELPENGLWIGREAPANVVVANSAISRLHVWVGAQGDEIVALDERSSNGTFLDGERFTRRPLLPGDVVTLALDAASFRFEAEMPP